MTSTRSPGLRIVHAIARLVPPSHRDEWLAEWTGEIDHAWRSRDAGDVFIATRLRLRSLGAIGDAVWMRRRHGALQRRSLMFGHDLRFAARSLARRPTFTTIVVATLALCIGANTAVFTIVDAVLRRGLPYADLDQLVAVWSKDTKNKHDLNEMSVGDYQDMRARNHSFRAMAAYFPTWNATFTSPDVAERIDIGVVSANFFDVLGARPAIGRGFVEGEDLRSAPKTVILSHAFWTRMFNADPRIVGRTVTLDGESYAVIGVLANDFTYPRARVDMIATLPMLGDYLDRRQVHLLTSIGRLRPGVTLDAAQRELVAIAAQLEQEHPHENAGYSVTTRPLTTDLLGDVRRPILVLFGAVCVVLLIGCVNVGNLMLTRTVGRQQELAVRVAMGAEPGAIARQILTESGLVAAIAGLLGAGIAVATTMAIAKLLPPTIANIGHVRVDGSILAFTLLASLVAALLSGLAPAIHVARRNSLRALTETARGGSKSRSHRRLQRALVVSELALALVLTVSAGLLINSFSRLARMNTGFASSRLVRVKVSLPAGTYAEASQRRQFYAAVVDKVRALPGVQSAGYVTRFPLHDSNVTTVVAVEGATVPVGGQSPDADLRSASSEYFSAMGIPVIEGRSFTANEPSDSAALPVLIVNRSAARTILGSTGGPVLGKRARLGGATSGPFFTIVGVVGDVYDASLRSVPRPQVYMSTQQSPPRTVSLVVRYSGSLESVLAGVRRAVAELDRTLPVYDAQSVEEVLREANRSDRFTTSLLTAFSFLALLLAALGTYGVIAQGVSERTQEIGVRIALGARGSDVRRMVLREGLVLVGMALPFALVGIVAAGRALSGLLFEVGERDPVTMLVAAVTLGLVALVACYVPALRASRVDPVTAMRGS
jgi:predicted permease